TEHLGRRSHSFSIPDILVAVQHPHAVDTLFRLAYSDAPVCEIAQNKVESIKEIELSEEFLVALIGQAIAGYEYPIAGWPFILRTIQTPEGRFTLVGAGAELTSGLRSAL